MCLGVPGRIIDVRNERGTRMATIDFDGVTKTICLAYVPKPTSATTRSSTPASRSRASTRSRRRRRCE